MGISIALGQCGIQLCNQAWELFALEHGIEKSGANPTDESIGVEDSPHNTFFSETGPRNVPRNVMIDLEPSVADEIKTGEYRDMFNPENFVTNKEDAASNYARGHYTVSKGSSTSLSTVFARRRTAAAACKASLSTTVWEAEPARAPPPCFLSVWPRTTPRSPRCPSPSTHRPWCPPLWLSRTTRCCPRTTCWSTPMSPSCLTTRPCTTSASAVWTWTAPRT